MSETKTKEEKHTSMVMAQFDDPGALLHAAEKTRDAGYKEFDCHSPFPVHGMDGAMGLSRSPLAKIVFVIAMSAVCGMIALTYYVSVIAYPLVISGKPLFSYVAYAPPIFAIGVLTGALTAVFGMLALNKLPTPYHPLFNSPNFSKVTDDGFFVTVQSSDPQYDEQKVKSFLTSIGGKNVEVIQG